MYGHDFLEPEVEPMPASHSNSDTKLSCKPSVGHVTDSEYGKFQEALLGEQVIQHEMNSLDKAECARNAAAVRDAKLKEITNLFNLKCPGRKPRKQSFNIIDTRWVIK